MLLHRTSTAFDTSGYLDSLQIGAGETDSGQASIGPSFQWCKYIVTLLMTNAGGAALYRKSSHSVKWKCSIKSYSSHNL